MNQITEKNKTACMMANCTMAQSCLRYRAFEQQCDQRACIEIVNPRLVTGNAECTCLVEQRMVVYARGFRNMLMDLPVKKVEEFRNRMISLYPRNKYFKIRRGDLVLTHEDEQMVRQTLRDIGVSDDVAFDSYVEKSLWEE